MTSTNTNTNTNTTDVDNKTTPAQSKADESQAPTATCTGAETTAIATEDKPTAATSYGCDCCRCPKAPGPPSVQVREVDASANENLPRASFTIDGPDGMSGDEFKDMLQSLKRDIVEEIKKGEKGEEKDGDGGSGKFFLFFFFFLEDFLFCSVLLCSGVIWGGGA
ncbi:hypothetical protein GGR53DRAFT_481528, partial [Hypoxylon sp. FL1150]